MVPVKLSVKGVVVAPDVGETADVPATGIPVHAGAPIPDNGTKTSGETLPPEISIAPP